MEWSSLLNSNRRKPLKGTDISGAYRSEFQRDYQKIICSASFRRLQDKTQVFPLDKSDFIRTRLTHSLEVSAFAKSLGLNIGSAIYNKVDKNFTWTMMMDMSNVLQCAGLIHDIGNPPFGHFGETAIRRWFAVHLPELTYYDTKVTDLFSEQMLQDFYQFEGNAQALRVISKLHYLSDDYGMNLTYALMSTVIKYPCSSLEADPKTGDLARKKMGYYYADRGVFQEIQEATGTLGKRNPMTFILEAADDIAYKTADIEDAVKKGCITLGTFERELDQMTRKANGASDFQPAKELQYAYEEALKSEYASPEFSAIQSFSINAQNFMMSCASRSFVEHYKEIMAGEYKKDLLAGTEAEALAYALSDIAYRHAFVSDSIYKLEIAAGQMLAFLLDKFVHAAMYYDTDEKLDTIDEKVAYLISDNYIKRYRQESEGKTEAEKLYLRLLLVTDLVCGMTDGYARTLYQELNGMLY